jgi:hypothetical protein
VTGGGRGIFKVTCLEIRPKRMKKWQQKLQSLGLVIYSQITYTQHRDCLSRRQQRENGKTFSAGSIHMFGVPDAYRLRYAEPGTTLLTVNFPQMACCSLSLSLSLYIYIYIYTHTHTHIHGWHAVGQLVETLHYKSESRGFDSRLCHWSFSLSYLILPAALCPSE